MNMLSLQISKHRNILYRLNGLDTTSQCFTLQLHCYLYKSKPQSLLKSNANLSIQPPNKQQAIQFNGIISNIISRKTEQNGVNHCSLTLKPRLWLASLQTRSDIYNNASIIDIIEAILIRNNILYKLQLHKHYPRTKFNMQYQQSDLDFFQQQLIMHQLHYYFLSNDQIETLIIADDITAVTTSHYEIFDPTHITTNTASKLKPYCYIQSLPHQLQSQVKHQPGGLLTQPLSAQFQWSPKNTCSLNYLQQGALFYPHQSDILLISFMDGNYQQPIALTSLYNKQAPFQSTHINGIKTQQHTLRFDDQSHRSLSLETQQNFHKILTGSEYATIKNHYQYKNSQANKSIQLSKGHYQLNASHISCKCQSSSLIMSASTIILKSNNIHLLANNTVHSSVVSVGDFHSCPLMHGDLQPHCGGPIVTGSNNVFFNGKAAACHKDVALCQYQKDNLKQSANNIQVNHKPIAYKNAATMHGGIITTGSHTIKIGPAKVKQNSAQTTEQDSNFIIKHKPYHLNTKAPLNGQLIYGDYHDQ